ncbi:MAG: shikimate dehydrogenase [Anaerolineales bacterium]
MKRKMYSLGLTGHPLFHSLSPTLHNTALRALGLEGEYRLYPVPPLPKGAETLAGLLARARRGEIHGLNVTIPHKQNAIPLLDDLTPATRAIGAANTIFRQGDRILGDNTDAPGFLADLKHFLANNTQYPIPNTQSALILGAGGSARAVAYALLTHGWHITLAARRPEQAQALSEQLLVNSSQSPVTHRSIRAVQLPITNYQLPVNLIVNTTPLGMSPHTAGSPWPGDLPFPPNAAVYDLVYNPRETTLVRRARAAGLPAVTGLGMLIEQAALAFERWTGRPAPRAAMWQAVSTDH